MPRTLAIVAIVCATLGSGAAQDTPPSEAGAPAPEPVQIDPAAYRQIEILMRAFETVRENYVDEDKVGYERLVEGALEGMFRRLDKHSQYINPRLLEEMRDAGENPENPAGVTLEIHGGGFRVASVAEGGPAARAGVKVGDLLLAIDGQTLGEKELGEVAGLLDGPPGKLLTLELLSPGTASTRTVGYAREQPSRETVTGAEILPEAIAGPGAKIGYLRLRSFGESTARELGDALDTLEGQSMAALVLDLRGNPGGLLDAAVESCGEFLPPGTLVTKAEGRAGTEHSEEFHTPKTKRRQRDYPLALLVNGASASSAEVLAGALKDYGRALVIGETTYGKGSIQTVVQMGLDTGAAMRLTTARFRTPKGELIDGVGVPPNLDISGEKLPITAAAKAMRKALGGDEPAP